MSVFDEVEEGKANPDAGVGVGTLLGLQQRLLSGIFSEQLKVIAFVAGVPVFSSYGDRSPMLQDSSLFRKQLALSVHSFVLRSPTWSSIRQCPE